MKTKKITLIVGATFYLFMTVLSFTARKLHIASLPKVTTQSLESLAIFQWNLALPLEVYDNQKVYVVVKEVVNGEERDIARVVAELILGQSNEDSYEVISGISPFDQVITTGQELIWDGCEVYVKEE